MSVCENCKGDIGEYCTNNDPYAGYTGAFECMANKDGDVAFVRHFTTELSSTVNTTWVPDVRNNATFISARVYTIAAAASARLYQYIIFIYHSVAVIYK